MIHFFEAIRLIHFIIIANFEFYAKQAWNCFSKIYAKEIHAGNFVALRGCIGSWSANAICSRPTLALI